MHTTRERILSHLKRSPGASVEALSQALDLAPMTIRQHLSRMGGDGLVDAESERRPTGRPALVYSLTPKGDARFPKAYDRLASLLLEELGRIDRGQLDGLDTGTRLQVVYRRISERAAEPHLDELNRLSGRDRIEAAVVILKRESEFAEVEDEAGGALVVREYNCVYQSVAQGHHDLCTFHTEYVRQLVGVDVVLDTCQCDGASACRFRIQA